MSLFGITEKQTISLLKTFMYSQDVKIKDISQIYAEIKPLCCICSHEMSNIHNFTVYSCGNSLSPFYQKQITHTTICDRFEPITYIAYA